jgi:hypothetical protein
VSASGRDYAKGSVVTLLGTGLGFVLSGPLAGVICLFVAGVVSLVLWTPVGRWLGFHSDDATSSYLDPCEGQLRRLRPAAHQLAHILEKFSNWWPAVEDESFKGKLPDDYETTHREAMETLLFMFGQFFSAAWTYQSFCLTHRNRGEVKELVDGVYDALGRRGDPGDLATDARVGSDQLHVVGERSTRGWGTTESRPMARSEFRVELDHHAEDFEPLRTFLRAAGPDTAACVRLEAAKDAVKHVEAWLEARGYAP